MKEHTKRAARQFCAAAVAALSLGWLGTAADTDTDTRDLEKLVATYARSIDGADTDLADQIWSNASEVSFIHPLGEEHSLADIKANVYRKLMGERFSERKLTPKDIRVHAYGDSGWSEFQWDFVAKFRTDGATFRSQGRETQIYRRENGRWRIVHIHYSGVPVTGS